MFVKIAAMNPKKLKFNSNELHRAKPSIIGKRDNFVIEPVNSPINNLDTITVNSGDELLIVSTNDIVACLSAIKPRTIENSLNSLKLTSFWRIIFKITIITNLNSPIIIIFAQNFKKLFRFDS